MVVYVITTGELYNIYIAVASGGERRKSEKLVIKLDLTSRVCSFIWRGRNSLKYVYLAKDYKKSIEHRFVQNISKQFQYFFRSPSIHSTLFKLSSQFSICPWNIVLKFRLVLMPLQCTRFSAKYWLFWI